jgi:hypothetical protein
MACANAQSEIAPCPPAAENWQVRSFGGVAWMLPQRVQPEGGDAMSRTIVGMVIDKLLTDENLRIRFAIDRVETVAELCLRGFDLTRDEIDLLCRTDAGVWFLRSAVSGAPQH